MAAVTQLQTVPALYAVVSHPLHFDLAPRDMQAFPEGATFADVAPQGDYVLYVLGPDYPEGAYITPDHWHYALPPGHIAAFHRPTLGGGGGAGSVRMVLMIMVMVFAPQIAIALMGEVGAATLAGAMLKAGIVMVGSAIVNAMVPLDNSNAPQTGGGSPTYSAGVQGNTARLDQPIPELFGHNNPFPDFGSPPYTLFEGSEDQYYYAILSLGVGHHHIQRVSLDKTPITDFDDFEIVRCGPGQSTRSGPGIGYETLAEQSLVADNVITSQDVTGLDMPTGRWVGPFIPVRASYRAVSIGIDIIMPRGLDDGREIIWHVQVREVDDFDNPVGAWVTVGTETYNTPSVKPIRLSYEYAITAKRPQIRVRRNDIRTDVEASAHDATWAGLRVTLDTPGISYDEGTYVCIKIRSSEQMSQFSQSRIRVLTNRLIPTWTGSAWSDPVFTRNPAWADAYVLKKRGLSDDQIDTTQLTALAAVWDARQDRFDFMFDTPSTMWDARAMILRVGRAVPLIRGGRFTAWRDQQETTPVAQFSMRDIRKGSFSLVVATPEEDPVDAIELEYYDLRRWDWVTVTAQWANDQIYGYRGAVQRAALGLSAPSGPARLRMPGIIGENHAIRSAVGILADAIYRPHRAKFETELQGLLPAYGSLVVLSHDIGDFGQCGDAADWSGLTLHTTEPLRWVQGAQHYVRLMKPDGTLTGSIAVTQPSADLHSMTLASDPGFTPNTADPTFDRTRYVFGDSSNMGALAKPRAIKMVGERTIEMELVLEDDRVHTADNAWLPSGEQDPIGGPSEPGSPDDDLFVSLSSPRDIETLGQSGWTPASAFTLRNDGALVTSQRQYNALDELVQTDTTNVSNQWLYGWPKSLAQASLYEARATLVSVDLLSGYTLTGTFDAWVALSSDFTIEFKAGVNLSQTAIVKVEIRDIATSTLQTSAHMRLTTTTTTGGEGA